MAYDRYDTRNDPRDERSRWRDERSHNRDWDRDSRSGEDRGFFERMGDEIGSWFGDDRQPDERLSRDRYRGRSDWNREQRDERAGWFGTDRSSNWDRGSGYRPMTGADRRNSGFSDSEQFFAASGVGRGGLGRSDNHRSRFERSARSDRDHDPHYAEWRRRHMAELDNDYEEYRREHQSKFEGDFGGWREKRQSKRQILSGIREHMEVVGSDEQHVGTVDRVAGDRIILTKSDPESGGAHHSLSCSDIDRVEGDKVMLDCSAEQAMHRWRDESRDRALFEREDQGADGPRILDRSFEGTYR